MTIIDNPWYVLSALLEGGMREVNLPLNTEHVQTHEFMGTYVDVAM